MNRKKIAIIGSVGLPAKYGGWEILVDNLISELANFFQLTVFYSSPRYENKLFLLFKSMNIFTFIRFAFDLIFSKIFFPKARIIRRLYYIRNEGSFIFGKGFSSDPGLVIEVFGKSLKIEIGRNMMAYHNLHIGALESVIIGAGSVVTKSLPNFAIAAGVPAKIIKRFDIEKNIWKSEK